MTRKPKPDRKEKTISIRVDAETYEAVARMADADRRTVSTMALIILEHGMMAMTRKSAA